MLQISDSDSPLNSFGHWSFHFFGNLSTRFTLKILISFDLNKTGVLVFLFPPASLLIHLFIIFFTQLMSLAFVVNPLIILVILFLFWLKVFSHI